LLIVIIVLLTKKYITQFEWWHKHLH
jgi:hypothetical protein